MLSTELLQAWWRLSALPRMGTVGLGHIRQKLPSAHALVDASAQDLIHLGLNPEQARRWEQDTSLLNGYEILAQWQQADPSNQGLLLAGVAPYPEALSSIKDAPTFLFYRGQLAALQQPMVAMVGSRNPTAYAQEWAQRCAGELATNAVSVVSGMAIGIDGCAHIGALQTGATIAVLGSGANVYYPKRHHQLAQEIQQNGLILSEFLPDTAPQARHFPARNRIVSGLSLACVVVEATTKSGSLITAKLAGEQGRDVFALPGAVTNPLSAGCHQLIRDGALLVRNSEDILLELGLHSQSSPPPTPSITNKPQNVPTLLHCIDFAPTEIDLIHQRSNLPMSELMAQLLQLEMDGWLAMSANGYMRIR